jgi:hypothetical protein
MSSTTYYSIPSIYDVLAGAARSMMDAFAPWRNQPSNSRFTADGMVEMLEQKVLDNYHQSCLVMSELKQADGFKQCENHFEGYYRANLPFHAEEMRKEHAKGKKMVMSILPCQFMVKKLPTDEQRKAWMSRWDLGSDLLKAFKRHSPEGLVMPYIHMSTSLDLPVQLTIVLFSFADDSGGTTTVEGDPEAPAAADDKDEFPNIVKPKGKKRKD